MGKGKKGKKKEEEDNWEDDLAEIAKESGIELNKEDPSEEFTKNVPKKKEKKNKKHKVNEDEEEEHVEPEFSSNKGKVKASFGALMIDDEEMSEDDDLSFENEDEDVNIAEETSKTEESKSKSSKQKTGKGGKKKKAVVEEEDDIDAILANLEIKDKPLSKKEKKKGKKKQVEEVVENDASPEQSADQHKENEEDNMDVDATVEQPSESANPKKDHTEETATKTSDNIVVEDDDEGPKIKTAAQKKAEKKEREKEKKKAEKKKKSHNKTSNEADNGQVEGSVAPAEKPTTTEEDKMEATQDNDDADAGADGENVEESGEEGETGDVDKKKKKKKKKKGKEEEDKKKGKKPGKSAIKLMQESLEKARQEEERLRLEEEAKQLALDEAEQRREEKLQLEKERKEKKKQKEKEKKERMKKEGKLLTPAQREQKRRAEQMLEAMKAQGISVPSKEGIEQRKKVQYGSKKKNNKQQLQSQTSKEAKEDAVIEEDAQSKEVQDQSEDKEASPKNEQLIQEDLPQSALKVEENVKDSWDIDLIDQANKRDAAALEKEDTKLADLPKKEEVVAKENEEDASDDSDESEEESSEEESSEEESESEEEYERLTPEKIKEKARERIAKRRVANEANRSVDKLRCPVICVLGHVDTGKTKILDKIRHTNVQDGEAGGITQQIGATMVPVDTVKTQTKMVKEFQKFDLRLPGLLIIDTPGHESFSNLRTRGSNLCDMAILVVDIMHGLEPQTLESINLLRKKHTPFIVALNKIDRLFEWKRGPASQIEDTVKKQKKNTKLEFEERVQLVVNEFSEQGLNAALFYKNVDEKNFISLVPTSAHSGDGMGDLMALICRLTQTRMGKTLAYSEELQSTVMEVKALPGLGTTVDVILVNGKLREGDTIVTGGNEGPVVAQIRAVLTPQPLRELRVKSNYIQHKELEAAQGCKITGKDLEKVMAGAPIYVAQHPDEIEVLKDEISEIFKSSLQAIKLSERGVYVQASTLGSLEALLEFLKTSKIPYSGVNIGPVHKKDVMKTSVMLEHEPLYAVILAFDVKVERDAQDLADREGLTIFTADIIYHLFDKFTAYTEDYKQKQKEKHKHIAVFPCKIRVLPQHIFNSRDPIVLGVNIEAGICRLGTPLTVPSNEFCDIGVVTGIEANHKNMERATAGQEVCIKIEPTGEAPRMYGRHFTHEDIITSKISRESIDALKKYFRDEMSKNEWQLIIELKKLFGIM